MHRLLSALALALLVSGPALGEVLPSSPARASGNISGTVTTGGTFQSFAVVNAARASIEFQNICNVSGNCAATTDNCYLYWPAGTATKPTSITVGPGGYYGRFSGTIPADAFQVTCDGSSDKYWGEAQ